MSVVKYPVTDSSFKYVINVPGSIGTYVETDLGATNGFYELGLFSGASTTLEFYGESGSVVASFALTSAKNFFTVFNEPVPQVLITHAVASESVVTLTRVTGETFLAENTVVAEYTSSGSISVAADDYYVLVVGGGGGGAGAAATVSSGGGGGSGGVYFLGPIALAGNEAIVIGSGGGGGATGANGSNGGDSSITISGSVFSASAGFGAIGTGGGVAGSPNGGVGGLGRAFSSNGLNGSVSTEVLTPYSGTTGGGGGGAARFSATVRTGGIGAGDGLIGKGGNGGPHTAGFSATGRGGGGGGGGVSYGSAYAGGAGSGGLIRIYKAI